MKSRSSFALGLMMSVSLIALSGCDEPKVDASIYSSVDQCKRDPLVKSDDCERSFKEAKS